MTPRCFSSSVSVASLFRTPRGLNAPVRWSSSALKSTSAPTCLESVADESIGVRCSRPSIRSRARGRRRRARSGAGRRHRGDRTSTARYSSRPTRSPTRTAKTPRLMLAVALSKARPTPFPRRGRRSPARRSRTSCTRRKTPHEANAQPVRCMMAVDERGDQQPDEEATGQVDGEGAPREQRERTPLDGGVQSVAGKGSERTAHRDSGDRWHGPGSFMS